MNFDIRRSGLVVAMALVLVSVGAGCAVDRVGGKTSAPAVRINDEEIPYREFEGYLRANFGDETPPADDAETRSRLFDQFVEERLLLQQARGKDLEVTDAQVEEYLAGLGGGAGEGKPAPATDNTLREQVRRNLLIQEYKNRVLLHDLKVSPEEVDVYYRDHPEEFRESRVVVLRQILLEEPEEAKRILAELRKDPGRFPVLAQQHSVSPDRGQPRPYEEEELPEPLRAAALALAAGEISPVVEDGGKYRIFQAVNRREGKNLTLEEARPKIQVLLLQSKAEEALARSLSELRQSSKIEIHRDALPFHYQGDYGG